MTHSILVRKCTCPSGLETAGILSVSGLSL